jgi:hypothetical protein
MVVFVHAGGWQLILHTVIFGAHGDRLHGDAMTEVLQLLLGRGLGRGGLSLACRGAGAAARRDQLLDGCRGDHPGVIADVDHIVGPIEVDLRDMRVRLQGVLYRVSTRQTMHAA